MRGILVQNHKGNGGGEDYAAESSCGGAGLTEVAYIGLSSDVAKGVVVADGREWL
jgi:hypothetical protein